MPLGKLHIFSGKEVCYEHFCGSVDFLEKKLKELGGEIIEDGLKVDGDSDDSKSEIVEWSAGLTKSL